MPRCAARAGVQRLRFMQGAGCPYTSIRLGVPLNRPMGIAVMALLCKPLDRGGGLVRWRQEAREKDRAFGQLDERT